MNDREAFDLIDALAARLLELSDGREIPQAWKTRFRKAIRPPHKKVGPKIDPELHTAIVADLWRVAGELERERTKHHNPGDYLNDIAKRHGVSRKTVDRIESQRRGKAAIDAERQNIHNDGFRQVLEDRLNARDNKTKRTR